MMTLPCIAILNDLKKSGVGFKQGSIYIGEGEVPPKSSNFSQKRFKRIQNVSVIFITTLNH